MFDIININIASQCSIEEYIDYINSNISLDNYDSIKSSALKMKELYNNRTLITNYLNLNLKSLYNFQNSNTYAPPSLILGKGKGFFVRANIWDYIEKIKKGNIHVYGLMHDHNFNFMTLNYKGPGYVTSMYSYNYEEVSGQLGEKVELREIGSLNLKEGEMFIYKKNFHIHTQFAPSKLSISLNLMIQDKDSLEKNQYVFDNLSHRIIENRGHLDMVKSLIKLGTIFGDNNTLDIIQEVKKKMRI